MNVIVLSVIMLNVIIVSVIMISVVAPCVCPWQVFSALSNILNKAKGYLGTFQDPPNKEQNRRVPGPGKEPAYNGLPGAYL
jgi:hypothetical protein